MRNAWLALLIAALALALPLAAQDEAPTEAAEESADEPAPSPPDAEEDEDGPAGAADSRAAADNAFEDFVPSEEVAPDEEVIFPVDF